MNASLDNDMSCDNSILTENNYPSSENDVLNVSLKLFHLLVDKREQDYEIMLLQIALVPVSL
jgi:hypothetical protein